MTLAQQAARQGVGAYEYRRLLRHAVSTMQRARVQSGPGPKCPCGNRPPEGRKFCSDVCAYEAKKKSEMSVTAAVPCPRCGAHRMVRGKANIRTAQGRVCRACAYGTMKRTDGKPRNQCSAR